MSGNQPVTGGGQAVATGGTGTAVGGPGSQNGSGSVGGNGANGSNTGNRAGSGTTAPGTGSSGSGAGTNPNGTGTSMSGTQGTGGANAAGPSVADGACTGHAGESVCDGAMLHKCGTMGKSMGGEACMSAALCQVGLATGTCGVCNPGTFHCEGVNLNVCTAEGQYIMKEPCASEALCNEDAGACTSMKCMPNTMTCAPDGSTLRMCNADGSDFADQQPCMGTGCNAMTMTCNTCMPGQKTCSGDSVATCNADGQTMAMTQCTPTSADCGTATCSAGACTQGKKTVGSPCQGSKKCDALGSCVACITPSDCPDIGPCATKTCTLGVCGGLPKSKGTGSTCGNNMECDGSSNDCQPKVCGGNKKVDYDLGEDCDKSAAGWDTAPSGVCGTNCKFTGSPYRLCESGGGDCWTNSRAAGWFCSAVGMCSRVCSGDTDCSAPNESTKCLYSSASRTSVCTVPCSHGSCSVGACQGTCTQGQCQWYGTRGVNIDSAPRLCGWVSSDPSMNNAAWCPGEIGTCTSPGGIRITAPPPMSTP